MENAHSAQDDAKAAAEVLDGQLEMYEDLPKDVASLGVICYGTREDNVDADGKFIWIEGEAVCTFGKNKGLRLKDIAVENPGFLSWVIGKDFSLEVKEIVRNALNGEFPQKE